MDFTKGEIESERLRRIGFAATAAGLLIAGWPVRDKRILDMSRRRCAEASCTRFRPW